MTNTTTKQQSQPAAAAAAEEEISRELLLKRFKLMDELVDNVRKTNLDNGLDSKSMDSFIEWREFLKRKQYEKWLQAVTNPKTSKFYSISGLKEAGIISEEEQNQFEDKTFPYRKLHQLYRVKLPSGDEYLRRLESWYGLTRAGSETHISVDDIDYYTKPGVQYSYVPVDPEVKDGKQIRVGAIRGNDAGLEPTGTTVYLTKFTPQRVHEFVKYANGSFTDPYHGTGLTFLKVGTSNPISIKSLEEFLSDFDDVWERRTQPQPIINVDTKLLKDIASAEGQKQYQ